MMLLACALIAATTIVAKALGTGQAALHPFQVTFGRFAFALLALLVFAILTRPPLTRPNLPLHLTRTIFGWGGVTLMFAAVTHIPVADATAISFLNPVFGMVLAVLVLGERVGPVRWVAAGIALLGAFILLRPGPSSFDPAALLALAAAAVMGVEITLIKILSGREPPVQILLMANIVGTILAGVTASFVWHWPTGGQWVLMVALGLTMVCAQALFIQAMRAAEASFVLPFSYATLVFAAVYDAVVFGARPDAVSALGAAVILAGAGVLAWRETRAARHA